MRYPRAADIIKRWFFILPFAGDWSYHNTNLWPINNPQCGGNQQSPIELNTLESTENDFIRLRFHHYRKPLSAPIEIINNGYSAEIGLRINEDRSRPYLTVDNFPDRYEIQAIHFHWGSLGVLGSEHSIDGQRFDLEMHIVHKNNKYASNEEARNFPDGFVILGVLFKAVPFEQVERHRILRSVYNSLRLISQYNSTAEIDGPLSMRSFLPELDTNEFFAYRGSLTTPPCSESALWFVFSNILTIPFDELKKFWGLLDSKGRPLLNNHRPLQVGNRDVLRKRDLFRFID